MKIKTHFMHNNFFFPENRAVYQIMWKNRAGEARNDNIKRRMRFVCWITKATGTDSEFVILVAFPRQQLLRERSSVVRLSVHSLSLHHYLRNYVYL
jgi:hypothetical protein